LSLHKKVALERAKIGENLFPEELPAPRRSMYPLKHLNAELAAQCIAPILQEATKVPLSGCEHFGDNIRNLACIQPTVSLKCFQR
jgi:hypothetical protein